jgi:ABC-type iron transport system FetAB permease component
MNSNQDLLLRAIKLILALFILAFVMAMILSHFFTRIFTDSVLFLWAISSSLILAGVARKARESKSKYRRLHLVFYAFSVLLAIGFIKEIQTVWIPFFS